MLVGLGVVLYPSPIALPGPPSSPGSNPAEQSSLSWVFKVDILSTLFIANLFAPCLISYSVVGFARRHFVFLAPINTVPAMPHRLFCRGFCKWTFWPLGPH
jgi:hypothetical protein